MIVDPPDSDTSRVDLPVDSPITISTAFEVISAVIVLVSFTLSQSCCQLVTSVITMVGGQRIDVLVGSTHLVTLLAFDTLIAKVQVRGGLHRSSHYVTSHSANSLKAHKLNTY